MLSYFGGGESSTYAHPVMLFATDFMTTNIDGGIKALSRLQISNFAPSGFENVVMQPLEGFKNRFSTFPYISQHEGHPVILVRMQLPYCLLCRPQGGISPVRAPIKGKIKVNNLLFVAGRMLR